MNINKECILLYLLGKGGVWRLTPKGICVRYKKRCYFFEETYLCIDGRRIYVYDFFKFILMENGRKPFSYNNKQGEIKWRI